MKNILYFFLFALLFFSGSVKAQLVENVIVEKYYVSDSLDATDTTGGRILPKGSITYRIFVDLAPGAKIKNIYGDVDHTLKIASDSVFYNYDTTSSNGSANSNFGYQINKLWFPNDPLLALDSWLTIGLATKTNTGTPKTEDHDGSVFKNGNNIIDSLLTNRDDSAGIPLLIADGLIPKSSATLSWYDNGFKDISQNNLDTTIFGPDKLDSVFFSNNAILQQANGTMGPTSDNKVLVAQLTTKGKISFELNLTIIDSTTGTSIKYVARKGADSVTAKLSRYLKYPPDAPLCGCKDPNYLEYNALYECENAAACIHPIVFGCTDSMACNYDPKANFNVRSMCCYPGYCNNRNLSIVCPGISNAVEFKLYPNPVDNILNLQLSTGSNNVEVKYSIFDSYGILIVERSMGIVTGNATETLDVSNFNKGLYMMRVSIGNTVESKTFMKN